MIGLARAALARDEDELCGRADALATAQVKLWQAVAALARHDVPAAS